MSLPIPKLDDRQFQDIVDEAKKRIPLYCPEWTDHNVSDPGVTMIELFAWMTDIILYRLNQVPELHYRKFMEMFGVTLKEPAPAKTEVTFWLSAPQINTVVIPIDTEISSTQTEAEEPIIFSTDRDFKVLVPELEEICVRRLSRSRTPSSQNLRRLLNGLEREGGAKIFSTEPKAGDALYFGFTNDLSNHILRFDLDFEHAAGSNVDPSLPPYFWEASTGDDGDRWKECAVEEDSTMGMNTPGRIQIHLPKMGTDKIGDDSELFWVRVKVKEPSAKEAEDGMRPYTKSPELLRVREVASVGGTTTATHANLVTNEALGQSDGEPNQRFYLQMTPILGREKSSIDKDGNAIYDNSDGEYLFLRIENAEDQIWQEVEDFSRSGAWDLHYTVDRINGEVRFGPAIREPDGTVKQFGATAMRGASIHFARYRHGGGLDGNIEAGKLNTLKTSIPYVDRVANQKAAWEGKDPESIEAAMARMPGLLRSQQRAVTEDDFEFLAKQVLSEKIARVKCVQALPDNTPSGVSPQIHVVVIPKLRDPGTYIDPRLLEPERADLQLLQEHLDQRRLLTARLNRPSEPAYAWASVTVTVRRLPGMDDRAVEDEILRKLYHYLNPLVGGDDGEGWPFGQDLRVVDVYHCLRGLPLNPSIQNVELFEANRDGNPNGASTDIIEIVSHGVIASGHHRVEFI